MRDKRTKRLISGFIAGVLLLNQMPVFTAAAEDTTLCEHHPVHEHCGYTEAVAGSPCTHDHVDCYITEEVCIHEHIDCGYSESLEENLCEHQCTEDGGCITRQLSCTHDHDDSCGYREEVKAQPCTYECLACTVQQDVTVIGIDVTTRPAKTQYVVDEALDVSGGVITVTYSDETTQTVAMTAEMVSGYNNAVACTQTLTVTYAEQTACFDIVVVPASSTESTPFLSSSDGKVVGEIMLTSKPTKTQYVVNQDELDVTGGVITVYYTDGTNSSVEMTADMVTNFDNTSVGTYWLDIVYEGKHAQYQIAILESEEKPLVMEWHLDFSKSKTIYFLNEPLDLNEVTLELKYSDGTTETINVTPDMVEGFDTSVTGEYHMVVWYGSNGYWQNYRVGTEETIRGSCGANTYWELTKAGVLTISGSGPMMHYNSEIGAPWRERSANVKNVVIEEGVTYIGYYAFSNCSNMTSIIIPSSVTRLGNDAFYGCNNLTDVYITDMAAWVSIDTRERADHPFYCNDKEKRLFLNGQLVTDVVIPDGVTYIGGRSFFHCTSIKSITLPSSVTEFSQFNVFTGCSNLTDVYIEDLTAWINLDHCGDLMYTSYQSDKKLYLNKELITDLVIPEGITRISDKAFYSCRSIRSLSLSDSVTEIGDYAFWGCTNLQNIATNDRVSSIGVHAFGKCVNLTNIEFPGSLTKIHYAAFSHCTSLGSITFPAGLTYIGDVAFADCTCLGEITFEGNAPEFQFDPGPDIAERMTFRNVVATVNYPADETWTDSVRKQYGGELTWKPYDNTVGSGTCGENLTWVLDGSGTLTISGTGTAMGFGGSTYAPWDEYRGDIKKLIIEEGVKSICANAFYGCNALNSAYLPKSLVSSGKNAFYGCYQLENVYITDITAWVSLQVTDTSSHPFFRNGQWNKLYLNGELLTNVVIPEGVTRIALRSFHMCNQISSVKLPDSLTAIGTEAFYMCSGLTSLELPDGITTIGKYAFNSCTALRTVKLPAGLTEIGSEAFCGCRMTSIVIPEGVEKIGDRAFAYCSNLREIIFRGNAPTFSYEPILGRKEIETFAQVTATAYYPASNTTWTRAVMQNYGGNITWSGTGTIPCPYQETFDVPAWPNSISWTFTPQKSGQYVISLDNLENPNYGAYAGIYLVVAGERVKEDYSSIQTKFSRYVYTLEAGVSYNIMLQYIGTTMLKDVMIRVAQATNPQGIRCLEENIEVCSKPEDSEFIYTCNVNAELLPWNAVGEISWGSSNREVVDIFSASYEKCFLGVYQSGSAVVTAHCGDYSDAVEVTVKEPTNLELNVPYEDTCTYGFPKYYIFTAEEAGEYHIKIESELDYYIEAMALESADEHGKHWFVTLEQGADVWFGIDGINSDSHLSEYTITVEKAEQVSGLELQLRPEYGNSLYASVIFTPDNSCEEIISWELSDESFSWVGAAGGPVRGWHLEGTGELTITVTSESGLIASRTVVVGIYGSTIAWMLDEEGTLTVQGFGTMPDAGNGQTAPWKPWAERIKNVVISEGITSVGNAAFSGCTNLSSVSLPAGLTHLGESAFGGCSRLQSIDLPDTLTWIGDSAFAECGSLSSIEVPDSVIFMGWSVFQSCTNLGSVVLSDNLTCLYDFTFQHCSNLKSVELGTSLTHICYAAFNDCGSLISITIPDTVSFIGDSTFNGCTSLGEIFFEGNAPEFQVDKPLDFPQVSSAFRKVTATAYYPTDNPTWTKEVMQDYGGTITWMTCGAVENRLSIDLADLGDQREVWIDGVQYTIREVGEQGYVDLPEDARSMVTYNFHVGNAADLHTQYPVSMKVWALEKQEDKTYKAIRVQELDDILQYSGSSIRITGKKGIRMITSVPSGKRSAMISDNLAGYKLMEYGTVLSWASDLAGGQPLVLGSSYAKSNYAYKRGVADPVFAYSGGMIQYTNVLVGFTNDQCKDDIAMRPYMILEDAEGKQVTIYGGIVYRSIGYIAYQNRAAFTPGSAAYNYVWDIIHHVYGDQYDKDYKG